MTDEATGYLRRQFDTAWALTEYHLEGLTTEECLWRPAARGLHVHPREGGGYRIDWPDHEGYDLGPSSIAWLTWHLGFWWSMVLDHSFGSGTLTQDQVSWPGTGVAVRAWVVALSQRWREQLDQARLEKLASAAGLATRRRARSGSFVVVNRIATEELEAWYFGGWDAVRASYPRVPATIPTKAKYRDPDAIPMRSRAARGRPWGVA